MAGAKGVTDDIFVLASDGTALSGPDHVGFHVNVAPNHAPVLTVPSANVSLAAGQSVAASSLFGATDADGDALTYYILDNSAAANSGHFVLNGTALAAGTPYTLTAVQFAQTSFVAGTAGDNLYVLASDGKALSGPDYTAFHIFV